MDSAVLDTDVASRLYNLTLPNELETHLQGKDVFITFVTLGEMLRGARKRGGETGDSARWKVGLACGRSSSPTTR